MHITKNSSLSVTSIFVLLLLPFLSVTGIRNNMAEAIYEAWQVVSCVCFFIFICMYASKINVNWTVSLFALYQLIILLSSTYHQGLRPGTITVTVVALFVFLLLQTSWYYEIVSALCIIVAVCVLVNFPVMLYEMNKGNIEFFVGGKNSLGIFLVPGAFLLIIHAYDHKNRISLRTRLLVALCLLSVFIGASSTGVVVSTVGAVLMVIAEKRSPKKTVWILAIFLCYGLLLLFFEEFSETEFWINFTEKLGKDSSLTSRTEIWSVAKEHIKENWLFGSGRGTLMLYDSRWGTAQVTDETHNFLLELAMTGGFSALTIYATLLLKTIKHLNMNNQNERMIFAALCALLINGLTEATVNNLFVTIILGIACRYVTKKN